MRVPEVTHGSDRAAVLPPLPFTPSLAVGGCGHRALRQAATTDDAWETPLGGHYGAGGTLGRDREPKGEAKGALRTGRASFWTAPARAGRGVVPESLSPPGRSIRGLPSRSPRSGAVPSSTPLSLEKGGLGLWFLSPLSVGACEMGRLKLPSARNLFFLLLSSEACYLALVGRLRKCLRKRIALNVYDFITLICVRESWGQRP